MTTRHAMSTLVFSAAIALTTFGCGGEVGDAREEPEPSHPDGALPDDTEVIPGQRPLRRMDIDQLDQSVRTVTGGIGWDVEDQSQIDRFSLTLGRPDYITATEEDRSASVVFSKFLNDMGRSVCTRLMERETSSGEERVFFVFAEPDSRLPADRDAIDQNLAYLLLRFHGKPLDASSPVLAPWRDLLEEATTGTDDPLAGWTTVCMGLIEHPDFFTY